ncbi:DUF359 domain-containing protein [Candidatus Bathyarchaeota archaeon]|nr:DUF359 domain-containing protein [Candidatus Bathyarchaeota archaeon]
MAKLLLTRNLRALLKLPLGEVLVGTGLETMRRLRGIVSKEKPPVVICVGDTVSRNAMNAGAASWVKIVDGREMRRQSGLSGFRGSRVFLAANQPGTISRMAWEAVSEAIMHKGSLVIIKGEEDLLTLPAILEAPENSIVVYGLPPKAGVTVVRVDKDRKELAKAILDAMICERG